MVSGEQVDTVKSGLLASHRGASEALDDLFNIPFRHCVAAVRIVVRR